MLDRTATRDSTAHVRLWDYIRAGGFAVGDRLPPERELVDQLGLSRTRLRRAFDALQDTGAVWRHVGKGTFVGDSFGGDSFGGDVSGNETVGAAAAGAVPADALAGLGRTLTPVRMMQARLCLEPALAREAAIHASGATMAALRSPLAEARAAASWAAYEAADDRFHHRVAAACDNAALSVLFDQLNRLRRTVAWGSVERASARPPADHSSFAEHEAIADAIAARDPDRAWAEMRAHLKSVSARLFP